MTKGVEEVEEMIEETTEELKRGKSTKPMVQKFPFSPESRIAELERKNAALEQIVKELQARIEELNKPLSKLLEELREEYRKEKLKKGIKSLH